MKKEKKVKDIINKYFFEFPCRKLKSKVMAFKYRLNDLKLSSNEPEIFICNKTSNYDKFFVSNCIENDFVFLKDEFIEKIYSNTLSNDEKRELFLSINQIKESNISLVIFPERHLTVFGEFSNIPKKVSDYIFNFGYTNINFINLIGSYFIRPVWINSDRLCCLRIERKFSITITETMEKDYFNLCFNKYMPSSACVYSHKIPVYVRGNKYAEDFETVFCTCPNCKSFFTLKSEFNCVKCNNCDSAFEFTENYEIDLTKEFSNLDEAKKFQYEILNSFPKIDKPIVTYNKTKCGIIIEEVEPIFFNSTISIFQEKIEYTILEDNCIINYEDIKDIYLTYNNTLNIKYINNKKKYSSIVFKGFNKENLYIIIELVKIFNQNKN